MDQKWYRAALASVHAGSASRRSRNAGPSIPADTAHTWYWRLIEQSLYALREISPCLREREELGREKHTLY